MDYQLFDADNHYYEARDTFTRHGDGKVRRYVRWISDGKRERLLFGDRMEAGIPNPTFNPISKPGAWAKTLKNLETGATAIGTKELYGELVPIPAAYQNREARLAVMDEQNVERAWMFPTLAVCVEHLIKDDADMMYRVFRAFNDWVNDDWGFNHDNRIYAPPAIPLLDVDLAVAEFERVLKLGARLICLRPGPCYGRSPADPYFDPFWSRVNEAGVLVTYHALGGREAYDDMMDEHWLRPASPDPVYNRTLRGVLIGPERPMIDTVTSLVVGNFFGRFPNIRLASIEMGSSWVSYLMHILDHAGGILERRIQAFGEVVKDKPSDIFKDKVYISPFPEEDAVHLAGLIGADRVLMGSDWPHPEGNEVPADFAKGISSLPDDQIRRIMRDNALEAMGVG